MRDKILDFLYFVSRGRIDTYYCNGWTLVYFDKNRDGERVKIIFEFKD